MPVKFELSVDAQAVLRKLSRFSGVMLTVIAHEFDRVNEETVGHIIATKMTNAGPRFLNVRTGRLRRSVRPSRARVEGNRIDSAIGSNVGYAGVHEYGFNGTESVKSFTRRHRRRDVYGKVDGKRKRLAQGVVFVRAHTRKVNFPARAPIRTGIEERADKYSEAISKAIVKTWEAENS